LLKILIVSLTFLKMGAFSPKFCIFDDDFPDNNFCRQYSDSPKFRGRKVGANLFPPLYNDATGSR